MFVSRVLQISTINLEMNQRLVATIH